MNNEPRYTLKTVENIQVYKNPKMAAIKKVVGCQRARNGETD